MSHRRSSPRLSSPLARLVLLAAGLCGATTAAMAAPCTGGATVYEGSRSAVIADQALWQRSGMSQLALLASYAPQDPDVVQARHAYERLRGSEAYDQEVSRVAAARGETLSGFSGGTACDPVR